MDIPQPPMLYFGTGFDQRKQASLKNRLRSLVRASRRKAWNNRRKTLEAL